MKRLACILLAACCLSSPAAEIKLAPGTWSGTTRVVVVIDAAGNQTVTPDPTSPVTITGGGGVVVVPPQPPPAPSNTLTATVKAATAAVPEYAAKSDHRRAMAFGMAFIAKAVVKDPVESSPPVADSRKTVRQFCDSAIGADADKWVGWWNTVDAKLNTMSLTPSAYSAALTEMATALTADLPVSADGPQEFKGAPAYGLSPEMLKMLFDLLLPLLLKLLGWL